MRSRWISLRIWRQPGAACALHSSSWLGVVKAAACVRRASSAVVKAAAQKGRSGAGSQLRRAAFLQYGLLPLKAALTKLWPGCQWGRAAHWV